MESAAARCRHPREYCKFRNSCMIHFLGKDNPEPAAGVATEDMKEQEGPEV